MLKIRLARIGRNKKPFFRIVLTDHEKPSKSGYKEILGWFDPVKHIIEVDVAAVKEQIAKGTQLSERMGRLMFQQTKDPLFEKFFERREIKREKKNTEKA